MANYVRLGNYIRGVEVIPVFPDHFTIKDRTNKLFNMGSHMGIYFTKDDTFSDKSATTVRQSLDRMARTIKARLLKENPRSKATLKDLEVVARCVLLGNYTDAFRTKLYQVHSCEYVRSLELMEAIKTGRLPYSTK
jgi:hypothetical protein